MTNALSTIEESALLGIGEYEPLVTFRTTLRGGSGSGEDITAGLVPQRTEGGDYDVQGTRLPALFVSRSLITPEETEGIHYTVELTLILPSRLAGVRMTGDQIQEAADLVLQAGQHMDNINNTSIAGRLAAAGLSQCSKYTFEYLAYEGTETQPRIVARIRFLVPYQALTGVSRGIRHA